jgi:acyl-coenzyme A thioesterase PaaI-like protein
VAGEVLTQKIWDHTDGLGVLQSLIAGDLPAPPIAHFCGIAPVDAETGTATWKMPASEWLCAPVQGRLYGGAIAMLAGTAIDGAVQTTLPAGTLSVRWTSRCISCVRFHRTGVIWWRGEL